AVTILFRLPNRFSLRPDNDDRFCAVTIASHLEKTVVAVMLPRQLNIECISVRERANGFRHDDDVLSKTRHPIPPPGAKVWHWNTLMTFLKIVVEATPTIGFSR